MATYDADVVVWAEEQAAHIRARRWDQLDIEHLADEIDDVGRSEIRELTRRFARLLAQWLKWVHQPDRRSGRWERALREQRKQAVRKLGAVPSLTPLLSDPDWIGDVWGDAVIDAIKETDLDVFPEHCPWRLYDLLDPEWRPS